MSLYFVSARYADNQDSLDLFIAADTPQLAKQLWMAHYGLDEHDVLNNVDDPYLTKLTYHPYGPNQVIPWADLERTHIRRIK